MTLRRSVTTSVSASVLARNTFRNGQGARFKGALSGAVQIVALTNSSNEPLASLGIALSGASAVGSAHTNTCGTGGGSGEPREAI